MLFGEANLFASMGEIEFVNRIQSVFAQFTKQLLKTLQVQFVSFCTSYRVRN